MRAIDKKNYEIETIDSLYSPSLVYFYNLIEENTKKIIEIAGGADKLWPHIKTHKMFNMIKFQVSQGITRFKCSGILEMETAAKAGAKHILLAYPLVGPNIARFIKLQKKYPSVVMWATGDNYEMFKELSDTAQESSIKIPTLIDVNVGMNRTGVLNGLDVVNFYEQISTLSGLKVCGLHCYDGHIHNESVEERRELTSEIYKKICKTTADLKNKGMALEVIIAGGSPTFSCYAKIDDSHFYYSPGTIFINDFGYYFHYDDLDMTPAAAIVSRVISLPAKDLFTLDLGYKGISADPVGQRGIIVDFPNAKPVSHSEEHWVFQKSPDMELPKVGTTVMVIPTHICPTTALYSFAHIVKSKKIIDKWEVSARNRE